MQDRLDENPVDEDSKKDEIVEIFDNQKYEQDLS